jgi:DNA-binding PadR family transcriptional regulator
LTFLPWVPLDALWARLLHHGILPDDDFRRSILRSLFGLGEASSLEVFRDVRRHTGVYLGPATLFVALHRLLSSGLVEQADSEGAEPGGTSAARLFHLTPEGRDAARAAIRELNLNPPWGAR